MFFTGDRFFRGLRLILALDSKNVAVGEVVLDAIEKKGKVKDFSLFLDQKK